MKVLKNNFTIYWMFNRNTVLGYIVFSITFFLFCYFFTDVYNSVDMTSTAAYIVIMPGIISYITFKKVHLQQYFILCKRSWWPLLINLGTPLILSLVLTTFYGLIRQLHPEFTGIKEDIIFFYQSHLVSIPIMLYAMLIIFERKYQLITGIKSLIGILIYATVFGVIALGVSFIQDEQLLENIRFAMIFIITCLTPFYIVVKKYWRIDT